MPTVLLVRHGRSTANTAGVLAGWSEGVALDDTGRAQAAALAQRLAALPLARVVTSPLERAAQTAAALVAVPGPGEAARPEPVVDAGIGEVHYGTWTGRPLKELSKEPLWRAVQAHPSSVTFPGEGGESMADMQRRVVSAIRAHDEAVRAEHGEDAVWVAVSHGDPIASVLADALGIHLDGFQRIVVDTCSVSVVRYTPLRPFVIRSNDTGGDLASLAPQKKRRPRRAAPSSDAVVGGAVGT